MECFKSFVFGCLERCWIICNQWDYMTIGPTCEYGHNHVSKWWWETLLVNFELLTNTKCNLHRECISYRLLHWSSSAAADEASRDQLSQTVGVTAVSRHQWKVRESCLIFIDLHFNSRVSQATDTQRTIENPRHETFFCNIYRQRKTRVQVYS